MVNFEKRNSSRCCKGWLRYRTMCCLDSFVPTLCHTFRSRAFLHYSHCTRPLLQPRLQLTTAPPTIAILKSWFSFLTWLIDHGPASAKHVSYGLECPYCEAPTNIGLTRLSLISSLSSSQYAHLRWPASSRAGQ